MLRRELWAPVFGNPKFSPYPQPLRVDFVSPPAVFPSETVTRLEFDKLTRIIEAMDRDMAEIYQELSVITERLKEVPTETLDDASAETEIEAGLTEDNAQDVQNLQIVPVDAVVYNIEEDKPKKGLFGRKK